MVKALGVSKTSLTAALTKARAGGAGVNLVKTHRLADDTPDPASTPLHVSRTRRIHGAGRRQASSVGSETAVDCWKRRLDVAGRSRPARRGAVDADAERKMRAYRRTSSACAPVVTADARPEVSTADEVCTRSPSMIWLELRGRRASRAAVSCASHSYL
jgi:hypothetical protein